MAGRPLCIVLLVLIGMITLVRVRGMESEKKEFSGVEKELVCQVEAVQGQGEKRVLIVRDVMENQNKLCERMRVQQRTRRKAVSLKATPGEVQFGEGQGKLLSQEVKIGNVIRIRGKIFSFSHPGNPGQFDEYHYYTDMGISYRFVLTSLEIENSSYRFLQQKLSEWRTQFFQQLNVCLPEQEAGIVSAMLLGEKSGLTEESKELYEGAGISHILAISGLHISLIGAGVFFLLRKYVMPMQAAAVVTGVGLLLYGELTGFPVATERAVIMMLCALMARFLGRQYDIYCALALSAMIQLTLHPMILFQAGFLLSYGTVLGIAIFVGEFQKFFSEEKRLVKMSYRLPDFVVKSVLGMEKSLISSLGMQMVTLPVILYFYYEWNPYSVFINLVILPFVSILIGMSVFAGGVSFLHLGVGKFLFGIVHVILKWNEFVCTAVLKLPFSTLIAGKPAVWQMIVYYSLLVVWKICIIKRNESEYKLFRLWKIGSFLLFGLSFFALFYRPYENHLRITNLDIGQGDCACIRRGDVTVFVDGGSSDVSEVGKYRICQYLKYYGIRRVDYLFFTHSDSDHTSGFQEIFEDKDMMGFDIGTVVLPKIEKKDEAYLQLEKVCEKNHISVHYMGKGDEVNIGNLNMRCLHPREDYDWEIENNYSLVLLLRYGKFHGLFTGDLEQTAEAELFEKLGDVDYLKVAHHGSKGASSAEFLTRVKPELAVISAGYNNRYGHPAPETLDRLAKVGAQVYCTIDCGAVQTWTDGQKWRTDTWKRGKG